MQDVPIYLELRKHQFLYIADNFNFYPTLATLCKCKQVTTILYLLHGHFDINLCGLSCKSGSLFCDRYTIIDTTISTFSK